MPLAGKTSVQCSRCSPSLCVPLHRIKPFSQGQPQCPSRLVRVVVRAAQSTTCRHPFTLSDCRTSLPAAAATAMILAHAAVNPCPAGAAVAAGPNLPPHQGSHTALTQIGEVPQSSQPSRGGAACTATPAPPLADIAGLFGSGDKDPIDPFTLYGTNFKKYVIEKLQGEKVVSRARGFTVDTCVSAVEASSETPEFQGLPTGDKVQVGDNLLCKRAIGPDLKPACTQSCTSACEAALATFEQQNKQETGYVLEPAERARVLKNCRRSCTYECTKSGKAHDFVVPYRR